MTPTLTRVPSRRAIPAVLSIAGSDSGGGAGIQADLKAFARCGVHGMTAITALTAQNTLGVTGVHPVPGDFIVEQVRAVAVDIGVDAVKIGMLGTAEIVAAVDSPAVGIMLDTFHMNMEEGDLPAAIRRAGAHLIHFQANENHRGFVGTATSTGRRSPVRSSRPAIAG